MAFQCRVQVVRRSNPEHVTRAPDPFLQSTCTDVKDCSSVWAALCLQFAECLMIQDNSIIVSCFIRTWRVGALPSGGIVFVTAETELFKVVGTQGVSAKADYDNTDN